MVPQNIALKVRPFHTARLAFLYARQSTNYGVIHHITGGRRQREETESLCLALGWTKDKIILVDYDDAVSGSSTDRRYGYLEMLSAIIDGKAGAIFSLESTRLSRDSADWAYLIKACDLNGTLIIDPDGIYDASDSNDATLMKVKALMSEMELKWITNRLVGAKRALAKKGELRFFVPTGFIWTNDGRLIFEPDEVVQEMVRLVFQKFEEIGSALGVVKYFAREKLKFPTRIRSGPRKGEYEWRPLSASRVRFILKNPIYAGVYVYGRTKTVKKLVQLSGGLPQVKNRYVKVPRDKWEFVVHAAHQGYISWAQYLANHERLKNNCTSVRGASRAGTALLQGLVICGKCGRRMSVVYPSCQPAAYICRHDEVEFGAKVCQRIPSGAVEALVKDLFFEAVAPAQIRISLEAIEHAKAKASRLDVQWEVRLKKARAAVTRAKERLLFVDYKNKPVFDLAQEDLQKSEQALEGINRDLKAVRGDQFDELTSEELLRVESLGRDLTTIWDAPTTDFVTKKNLLRCVINDITLTRNDRMVHVAILWKTHATTETEVEMSRGVDAMRVSPEVIQMIRELATSHTSREIAGLLNKGGFRNKRGGLFTKKRIKRLRERYRIRSKHSTVAKREEARVA